MENVPFSIKSAKLEVSTFTQHEDMESDKKNKKWGGSEG